jgi:tRNA 2-selenouridine synthase
MAFRLERLEDLAAAGFDDLIDARSPSEFAEDHLPGAISLPVLDDAERARVGTIYVQESRFLARKLGAALVTRNIAHHLETALVDREGGWRPLVYCWRGGQRSGTFAWVLREIGWRVEALEGGYRSYRRLVVRALYDTPLRHRVVVLGGMTCTAKTDLLKALAQRGNQVIDLEGLAAHRGSIFGGGSVPQPSQKRFESGIAMALAVFDPARPVVVEAESSKVGDLNVPPQIWGAMCNAPRIEVVASLQARARYFPVAYPDLIADPDRFCAGIWRLRSLHAAGHIEKWLKMVREGAYEGVAAELMQWHYDPRYAKSAERFAPNIRGEVALAGLSDPELAAVLPELEAAIARADEVRPG